MSLKNNSSYEDNMTLVLETWPDELSPAQLAAYEKAEKEHNDIRLKLNEIITASGGENIFSGDIFSAYQLTGISPALDTISKPLVPLSKQKPNYERSKPRYTYSPTKTRNPTVDKSIVIEDDEDDDDDLPLAKRTKKQDLKRGKDVKKSKSSSSSSLSDKPMIPAAGTKPCENTATGGLQVGTDAAKKKDSVVVDLTKDETLGRVAADSREITFNKLQGKTFPSLVVTARPSLRVKENVASDRASLDSKVKNVLMLTPIKFTEWLIQQGLVRSQQECQPQCGISLKLGMYSDASKFPYSGGYVWISECCNPTRFVSVFNGSIFEGSSKPPSILLKLIYHWSCQTVVQNVVQWVKVDNTFVKEFYTKLRSICTLALYQHMTYLGGHGRRIEVGVISLGTTTQDGQQRQVKVEVLGVLDPDAKLIRLRAVEPLTDGERNQKKRFLKILEPLTQWVRPESIILTDLTVDKSTLHAMGYKTVHQSSSVDAKHNRFNNSNIMDYLRRIVPRMFQNTLSLLSRQIIQQFLDELVWREWYGITPEKSFDNIVQHIAEQTRTDGKEQLSSRLEKVASNPFKKWNPQTLSKPVLSPLREALEATTNKRRGNKRLAETTPPAVGNKKTTSDAKVAKILPKIQPAVAIISKATTSQGKREVVEDNVALETYYYGKINGKIYNHNAVDVDFKANCPECDQTFEKNTDFMMHLYTHINISKKDPCKYCLENFTPSEMRNKHVPLVHPTETKYHNLAYYRCVICEARFTTVLLLSGHMQRFHVPSEMPYKCSGCDFVMSSHKMVIDHFYLVHSKSGILQCPFCLKIFNCFVKGEYIIKNVQMFMAHLRLHLIKAQCKKCNKCALWFTNKGSLKVHQLLAHVSQVNRKKEIKPYCSISTLIPRPRAKTVPANPSGYTLLQSFDNVSLAVDNGMFCLECDEDFEESNHIIGLMKCNKCHYQTMCLPSIMEHSSNCTGSSLPEHLMLAPLDNEMHCICGFSCSDGYSLATHLARCDRRSAYPSVEAAQDNTVKRNMLDMLGLVRRDNEGDEANEEQSQNKQQQELDTDNGQQLITETNKSVIEGQALSMDGNVEQNDEANVADQQQFNTQLSLDDLGPQSVMSTLPENDPTPQLKEDYQSLATPRVSHHHMETMNESGEFEQLPSEPLHQDEFESL